MHQVRKILNISVKSPEKQQLAQTLPCDMY